MENSILKLMYSQLETDKLNKELLLQTLINSDITETKHLECIKIIEKIVLIKESIKTLDSYLEKEI